MKSKTTTRHGRRRKLATALILGALGAVAAEPALAQDLQQISDERVEFNIAAQPLSSALSEFARQAQINALYFSDDLRGVSSLALRGSYTRQQALDLLLGRSGYNGRISGGNLVLTQEQSSRPQREGAASGAETAQTDASQGADGAPEEIVITGTRLRGSDSPSPVTTISREDIRESGAHTVTQLLRTLPQNFGAGPNETTRTGEGASNLLEGSSINLRGLGADSTLVLLNGRRVSTGGTNNALYVDVSSIPVSAIERVEVLTDGASAIYGSDAIGGVVNFILRDNFNGAETSAQYGAADDGEAAERSFSQALGWSNARGRLFGVYDYYHRDPLANADRAFASNSDLTSLGGSNFSLAASNPATVVSPILAALPRGQDGTGLTAGDFIVGQPNLQNTNEGQEILGEQTRQGVYLSGGVNLSDRFDVFGEARWSRRDYERARGGAATQGMFITPAHPGFVELTPGSTSMILQYNFIDDLGPVIGSGDVESKGLVLGANLELGRTWRAQLSGTWNEESGEARQDNIINNARLNEALGNSDFDPNFDPTMDGFFNPFGDGSNSSPSVIDYIRGWAVTDYSSEMTSADFQLSGDLFDLPAGAIQVAIGAEHRNESFGQHTLEFSSALTPTERPSPTAHRTVDALFAEARVPLIAQEQNVPLVHRLNLSLAGRHEDTSNGGADTTPKVGLLWTPVTGLDLRAAWGRSFKSPALTETDADSQAALITAIPDAASVSGFTNTLILLGTNPDLESERAETWTAGFTLQPPADAGLRLDFNIFRIDFDGRIASPNSPFTVLLQPDVFAPIITRDPDDAFVQSVIDAPYYIPTGPIPPASDVDAVVDARLKNLSRLLVQGIDLNLAQSFSIGANAFTASLSGTYLFDYKQAFSETSPLLNLIDTANNPIDLKLRAGLSWRNGGWNAAGFINYIDDYRDNLSTPNREVISWTTLDLGLGYAFRAGALNGFAARFNVRNAFDQDPPFFNNPTGIGYDPENADPIGRFVSLELTKTW